MTADRNRQLTPDRFDRLASGPRRLWGLTTIAAALGVSPSTARRWAENPLVPIHRPAGAGSHYADRDELYAWLKGNV